MAAVRWRLIVGAFVAAALLGFAVAHLIPGLVHRKDRDSPRRSSNKARLPRQSRSSARSPDFAGGIASVKEPTDQCIGPDAENYTTVR